MKTKLTIVRGEVPDLLLMFPSSTLKDREGTTSTLDLFTVLSPGRVW